MRIRLTPKIIPPALVLLSWLVVGCTMFELHPYETKARYTNLNEKAIDKILSQTPDKDTITIITMGDTQRFFDETEDFVKKANALSADFVLLNGDITDFGIQDEYEWVHQIMSKLNKPYLAVIGNHDLMGNGESVYQEMYGPLNSSFIVNGIKFILINTNSREYKFNGRVPDLGWLQAELDGPGFDYAVVVSHVPPYSVDFDDDLEQQYANTLHASQKVGLSLHGHLHSFREGEPYGDGIRYVLTTSMDDRMFLRLKIVGKNFTLEKIFY